MPQKYSYSFWKKNKREKEKGQKEKEAWQIKLPGKKIERKTNIKKQ